MLDDIREILIKNCQENCDESCCAFCGAIQDEIDAFERLIEAKHELE